MSHQGLQNILLHINNITLLVPLYMTDTATELSTTEAEKEFQMNSRTHGIRHTSDVEKCFDQQCSKS